ncbi:CinA family nicotinamide mononucleotide deamidase-related protein [Sediminibacterium sp. KACHI17]|jgi:nicotinamide-nucleotide amidase|uniref:CinA-like protein n=1 Tax=Sediminibacterium sp. KACHI17 TaxID=1751071 RepID=A0AAT9GH50_9BACT
MEKVFASIITIGDELLIGQVIDTNSAWIAQELNKAGILVKNRVAVGDVWDDIWNALDTESKKASIVLITGGLGPTADDITKPLLCQYFGGKMIMDEATLAHVTDIFERILKRPMIERNRKQAEVPDVCKVLKNERGTAPGMLFEKDGVIFIAMPGVPHEMKWIMTAHVIPLIEKRFSTGFIRHRTLLTAGIGESFLAEMIQDIETALPSHIKLAYLPNYGMVRLRLSGTGTDASVLQKEIDIYFQQLLQRTEKYLVTDDDIPMELVVGKLLKERKQTMTTAESCTGGYIAHLITKHDGSSAYYQGSIISYANEIKERLLSVPHEVLETQGAVSEETVKVMAETARATMQTDYALAVSGIMGPRGGTEQKPVGMVWVAAASAEKTVTQLFQFRFDRSRNTELTAINALNLLRQLILGKL